MPPLPNTAAKALPPHFWNIGSAGITRLLLEVRAGNAAAQSLYLKYGFTEVGIRKHYYPLPEGGHEDAVLMEKPC